MTVPILEDREGWSQQFKANWLSTFDNTGVCDWKAYKRPRNSAAPSGKGVDLSHSRLIFISTAGGYLRDEQEPFDAANLLGDYSIRLLPVDTPFERIGIAHDHYKLDAIKADPQVLLPLKHLTDLVGEGVIGALSPSVISFMGYQPDCTRVVDEMIPPILEAVNAEQPDAALLVPA